MYFVRNDFNNFEDNRKKNLLEKYEKMFTDAAERAYHHGQLASKNLIKEQVRN